MYTVEWASNFKGFSKEEKMDLQKFVLFYDEYIAEKLFVYTTTYQGLPSFVVEARRNQFPHLMGLQKWNNLHVKQPSKQYELLLKGEWDLSFLKSADKGTFSEYRARIEFLPNLYNFLYKYECHIKLVSKTVHSSFKNRKIDMIFQKEGEKLTYVLELREKFNKDQTGVFVLTSVTVHNKNSSSLKGKFVKLNITGLEVIDDK